MKKLFTIFALLYLCTLLLGCSLELSKENSSSENDLSNGGDILDYLQQSGYRLSWSDEFNADSLDKSFWNYETGNGTDGWGNQELQYYSNYPSEVFVSDGNLNIVANKKENGTWMSGRITTQYKKTFKYGYIEARVKLPSGSGMWPAFWLLGVNEDGRIDWPSTGEFDIMEYSPATQGVGKVYSTLHTSTNNGGNGLSLGSKTIEDIDKDYHRFGLLWTEEYIEAYYDGERVGRQEKPANSTNARWAFDREAFIILNLAIGGVLGGDVPSDAKCYEYLVDYVRIYSR